MHPDLAPLLRAAQQPQREDCGAASGGSPLDQGKREI